MKAISRKFTTVDEYFATLPDEVKPMLEVLRKTIKEAAPKAVEVISYNMPAVRQNGVLVYYAAAREHIGFYPTAAPIRIFKEELASYKTSKGAIQFPIGKPIPKGLVKKIVKYRVSEDLEKTKRKAKK